MATERIPKTSFLFSGESDPLAFSFGEEPSDQPRFKGLAYSGGIFKKHPKWGDLIVDLATLRMADNVPVLREHDRDRIVGQTTSHRIEAGLEVEGVLFDDPDAKKISKLSSQGHKWEMSGYFKPDRIYKLSPGQKTVMNGLEIEGPKTIFMDTEVREVSFVTLGADPATFAMAFSDADDLEIEVEHLKEEGEDMELQAQLDAMTAERDQLFSDLDTAKATIQSLKDQIEEDRKVQRESALEKRFADAGIEVTKENKEELFAMSDAQVDLMVGFAKKQKPQPGNYLFSDIANSGGLSDDEIAEKMAAL